jgi:hypothetical protein
MHPKNYGIVLVSNPDESPGLGLGKVGVPDERHCCLA